MFHQNIRGLHSNFHAIEIILQPQIIDILTLSETHVIDGSILDNDALYKVEGYNYVKKNRKTGQGGGVAIYVRQNLAYKIREDLDDNLESVWIDVLVRNSKSLLVGCFYKPPIGSNYSSERFTETLSETFANISKEAKEMIVLGDFNTNYLSLSDNKELKSLFRLYGLKQYIKSPTRVTENTSTLIDLILSNNESSIVKTGVFAIHLSVIMIWLAAFVKFTIKSIHQRL